MDANYSCLSKMQGIEFVGNIEGRDVMNSECDVVVADGFSGHSAGRFIPLILPKISWPPTIVAPVEPAVTRAQISSS